MESLYHHSDFTAKEDAPPPEFPEKEISSTSELQPSLPFRTPFALINIAQGDRIRIVGFPATELPALESIIAGAWPRGIQDSRTYGGGHEIKLKGNPWVLAMTARQVVESRCFVVGLLRGFFERGWVIKAATGVNKNTLDLTTLIFRHQTPAPPSCEWLCIHFWARDRMLLIGSPPDVNAALMQALGDAVAKQETVDGDAVELKMHGLPWIEMNAHAVDTQVMLLSLVQVLESYGWSLYVAARLGTSDGGTGSDSWFCVRDAGWWEGAPVYH